MALFCCKTLSKNKRVDDLMAGKIMKKKVLTILMAFMVTVSFIPLLGGLGKVYALDSTGNATLDAFINDSRFTDGVSWTGSSRPKLSSYDCSGCCAYCADYVKYCYGIDTPRGGSVFYDINEIRAGDVLVVGDPSNGTGHWFVCLARVGNSLYVAEGAYVDRVRIGWNYTINGNKFSEDSRSFNFGYHYLSAAPDTTKPVISNISISDRTSSGYTVSCTVTDNVGVTNVQFGTFESKVGYNGEAWYDGTRSGDTWSFKVTGLTKETYYVTHIYAYDAAGNSSSASTPEVFADKTKPQFTDVRVTKKTDTGFTVECTVSDNTSVRLVQFAAFDADKGYNGEPWYDGARNGNTWTYTFTGLKKGTAYYCHMYAYDECNNSNSKSTVRTLLGDTTKPVISDVKVIDKTENGFTVTCNVTDNEGVTLVQFAAFDADQGYNGETWYDGKQNGDVWSCTFRRLDKEKTYYCHMYAYDADGNSSGKSTEKISFVADDQQDDGQNPDEQTPDDQQGDKQNPDSQTPDQQQGDEQNPGSQTPDDQQGDKQNPDSQTPDNQQSDDQKPDSQTPDQQQSGEQDPDNPIPTVDPTEEYGSDGTAVGPGASEEAADEAIKNLPDDSDPAGAKFAPLKLKSSKQGKTYITLKWTKVKGAKKYVIYANTCGKRNKPKRLAKVSGNTKTVKKVAGKKLKKGTYYKFMVVALDSNNRVISTSKIVHIATKGGKVRNYTKLTTKAKKNKVTLKKGKTFKLGAKAKGKNVKKHVGVRYESSNKKVATVTKSGKIKAKKKGTCKIYVFAQNGLYKTIKVTVK